MERNARYLVVGSIVLASLVGMLIFLTWIFSGASRKEMQRYSVIFEDSVSGLNVSSPVEYKGVRVGQVIDIIVDEDNPEQIRVDIAVAEDTPIKDNTRVSLGLQGITGLSRIELETGRGGTGKPPVTDQSPYPLLKGDGRQLGKLFENLPKISNNILEISSKINHLLDDKMTEDIRVAVQNMQNLTQDLSGVMSEQNVQNLSTTLENTARASESFVNIGKRFDDTATAFDEVARQLSRTIEQSQKNIDQFTREGLDQMLALSQESRDMAKQIRQLADKLEEDPSKILYKPKQRGVQIAP